MPALESAFSRLELRLQSLIEGSLARLFPISTWQTELAHRLSEALHGGVQPHQGVRLAPDRFTIFLPPEQAILFLENPSLISVLAEQVNQAAVEAGYRFRIHPRLRVLPSPEKQNRNIQVVAEFSQDQSGKTDYFIADQSPVNSLGAFLIVDGKQLFLLSDVVTNIGRLNENHLIIADGRVSRRHAQIRFVQDHYVIFDLGSSGGTYVNNVRITQSILNPGDIISLAGVAIVFGMEDHERFMANTQKLSPFQE